MNRRNINFSAEPKGPCPPCKTESIVYEAHGDDTLGVREVAEYLQIGKTRATEIIKELTGLPGKRKPRRGYLRISRARLLSHIYADTFGKR